MSNDGVDSWTKLLCAAMRGDLKFMKKAATTRNDDDMSRQIYELIRDCQGFTSLHYAAMKGYTEICKFLVGRLKVNINIITEKGYLPLNLAISGEHIRTSEYLVNNGADITLADSEGMTALHYAAQKGLVKLMELLISKGAKVDSESILGTPLQCAARYGKKEAIQLLLNHCSDPNSVSPLSYTPLMLAVIARSFECMDLLLKAGADPNIKCCGLTPLAYAASEGETKIINFLLEAKADPNAVGIDDIKPLEHAAYAGHSEVVEVLFPVTSPSPFFPIWSQSGVMIHARCRECRKQREQGRKHYFKEAKEKGKIAFKRGAYMDAVEFYSKAIYTDPKDEKVLSNRSLCWALLGKGCFSLADAKACVELKPNWAKAHFREGEAWKLLKNYHMTAEAFARAWKLDGENKEIQDAFSLAVNEEAHMVAREKPLVAKML